MYKRSLMYWFYCIYQLAKYSISFCLLIVASWYLLLTLWLALYFCWTVQLCPQKQETWGELGAFSPCRTELCPLCPCGLINTCLLLKTFLEGFYSTKTQVAVNKNTTLHDKEVMIKREVILSIGKCLLGMFIRGKLLEMSGERGP